MELGGQLQWYLATGVPDDGLGIWLTAAAPTNSAPMC